MKVGFTGTQSGMTPEQKAKFKAMIKGLKPTEFHHGDCIGADFDAHEIARGVAEAIVVHPPDNPAKRSFCAGDFAIQERPYLERNKDIVNSTHILFACPSSTTEQLRSGTWSTVRYARKIKRRVVIIYPDGSVQDGE